MNLVEKDMSLCTVRYAARKRAKIKVKGRKGFNWKISRTQGAYGMSIYIHGFDLALEFHLYRISRKKYRNLTYEHTVRRLAYAG